jgi:hypothetical protein
MNKNPGFVKIKSPQALEEDIQLDNPIATALKRRRKILAADRGQNAPPEDSFGNPTIDPEQQDQT